MLIANNNYILLSFPLTICQIIALLTWHEHRGVVVGVLDDDVDGDGAAGGLPLHQRVLQLRRRDLQPHRGRLLPVQRLDELQDAGVAVDGEAAARVVQGVDEVRVGGLKGEREMNRMRNVKSTFKDLPSSFPVNLLGMVH